MPEHVADQCPRLCSRLWAELDIIPLVVSGTSLVDKRSVPQTSESRNSAAEGWDVRSIDEQAESMARKCIRFVGPV
jgi:hypothetical protein